MTFRRIHTDSDWWFCVFRSDKTGEHVLIATVPGVGCYDIAMRLGGDEVAMFQDRPADFIMLARNFVASREYPIFKSRLISFRQTGADLLDVEA